MAENCRPTAFAGASGGHAPVSLEVAKALASKTTRPAPYAGTFTALEEAVTAEGAEVLRAVISSTEVTTSPIGRRRGHAAAMGAAAFPLVKMVRRVSLGGSGSTVGTTEAVASAATIAFCRSRATTPAIYAGLLAGVRLAAPSEERLLREAALVA